jgi:predicted oxidoreductase
MTIVCKMDIINFPPSIDTTTEHLTTTVNWFLEKLQTTYLDVVLLHFPDSFMNATEVARLFNQLKQSGQVKYFGTSNHYPSQRKVLQSKLDAYNIKLVTNEVEVSVWNPRFLNYNSNDMVNDGILEGYRNLAWGALGGNPLGGFNRLFGRKGLRQERILHALKSVGKAFGEEDETVVALAWLLSHSAGFVPLIGTTQISRVNALVKAFDYINSFSNSNWWEIARAGGVCFLADIECDYEKYRGAHEYWPEIWSHLTNSSDYEQEEEA